MNQIRLAFKDFFGKQKYLAFKNLIKKSIKIREIDTINSFNKT